MSSFAGFLYIVIVQRFRVHRLGLSGLLFNPEPMNP